MGSLEKSHSKVSNFKLTMICFLLTLSISAVWVGLSLLLNVNTVFGSIVLGAGGVGTLLFMYLISKFTR